VKVEPVAAVAVRVTLALASKAALQVAPQSMPAGVEVTVPLPVPAFVAVRGWLWGRSGTLRMAAIQTSESLPVLMAASAPMALAGMAAETS
jgi:hypothetical protein